MPKGRKGGQDSYHGGLRGGRGGSRGRKLSMDDVPCPAGSDGKHPRGISGCGCPKDPEVIRAREREIARDKAEMEREGLSPVSSVSGRAVKARDRVRCTLIYTPSKQEKKLNPAVHGHVHWCWTIGPHRTHTCARPGCGGFSW
jgi:hypothetical protein